MLFLFLSDLKITHSDKIEENLVGSFSLYIYLNIKV